MIHCGDLFDVLPTLEAESIDAVVTDPPYGLEFMGKEWDKLGATAAPFMESLDDSGSVDYHGKGNAPFGGGGQRVRYGKSAASAQGWHERWAREVYRVLKPGAYLVAFGGTRTYHRMTCAIEDAGFEIRDCLCWLYGQGFPKSLDVSKAIDRELGQPRAVAGRGDAVDRTALDFGGATGKAKNGLKADWIETDPNTDAAKAWAGWGTALKPAYEPIVLARKPLIGSVAENVLKHGAGAINIDACRIGEGGHTLNVGGSSGSERYGFNKGEHRSWEGQSRTSDLGRWPANVLLDEEAAKMLDEQSGECGGGFGVRGSGPLDGRTSYAMPGQGQTVGFGDSGGASRFFYIAKPSREERDHGIYDLAERSSLDTVSRDPMSAGANNPRAGAGRTSILNTSEIVYTDPLWVDAALSQRLQADTDSSRRKAIEGSTIQSSDGSVWSMCWCGSPSTDPYHPVIRSIIATDRSSITGQIISNSSRRPHTNGCMAAAFGVMADGGNLAAYVEFQSPWKRLTGTSRKKAGPSTDGADLATSVSLWLTSKPENGGGRRVGGARNIHPT